MARFRFQLEANRGYARAGALVFDDGTQITTPVFMPVGTQASVKALRQEDLEAAGYQLILANTYHLYLRPGNEVLQSYGGVRSFMSWPGKILTDSGGYQAFSLSSLTRYLPDGVEFRSHLDGSKHLFTPELVLDIQAAIASDIVMPIDDCAPVPADETRVVQSLDRTHRWFAQSYEYWQKTTWESQNLLPIIQGGVYPYLRLRSLEELSRYNTPGIAVGGLSVGESREDFDRVLQTLAPALPGDKARYLMGVGTIPEIIAAVECGIDMFDCVLPTRNARNGTVFTSRGKVNLRNEKYRFEKGPVDPECDCPVCQRYSLGYIRHLFKAQEILALELASFHTLWFMKRFMEQLRTAIVDDSWTEFRTHWLKLYPSTM